MERVGRELHKYAGKRSRSETSFYSLQLDRPPAAVLERLIRFYGPPRESYDRNCVNLSFSRELETSVGSEKKKKKKKKRKRSRREDPEVASCVSVFSPPPQTLISLSNRKLYYVIHMFCLCL